MQFKCCLKNGPALEYRVLRYKIAIQASIQMLFKNGLGRGRGGKKSADFFLLVVRRVGFLGGTLFFVEPRGPHFLNRIISNTELDPRVI